MRACTTHTYTLTHIHTVDKFKNVFIFLLIITILVSVSQKSEFDVSLPPHQGIRRLQLCCGKENAPKSHRILSLEIISRYANECDCLTSHQTGVQVLQAGGVSWRSRWRAARSGVLRDGGRGGGGGCPLFRQQGATAPSEDTPQDQRRQKQGETKNRAGDLIAAEEPDQADVSSLLKLIYN